METFLNPFLALKHLHDRDVMHLDIKLDNILMTGDGTFKLSDFGIALDCSQMLKDALEGDPKYVAPELLSEKFTKSADIFSLGISMLELSFDLNLPQHGVPWQRLREGRIPHFRVRSVSNDLFDLMKWMMHPEPEIRPTVELILKHQNIRKILVRRSINHVFHCLAEPGKIFLSLLSFFGKFGYDVLLATMLRIRRLNQELISPMSATNNINSDDSNSGPEVVTSTPVSDKNFEFSSITPSSRNGEEWYRLRSAVQQMMLRPAEVQYYLPLISSVADDFIKRLNEKKDNKGEVPNLRSEIAKWSLESSGMVCFETRLGSFNGGTSENEAEKMITANKYIFHLSALLKFSLPLYKYFPSSKWNKLVQEEDYFYGIGGGYVDKTILKINQLEDQGKMDGSNYRFISYLLSKSELSLQDVKIIVLSLFGDGLSTTTPTLLFNLYCLAANPDVQKRAYEEVSSLIKGGPITIELLNQMSYLKAVIKETFRVLPNGTEISRILSKDLVLSGYLVPAGTHVNMNQSVLYHSEKYFVDPDKFLPERWLRGKHSSNIHPYLLIPFGVKARTCAGRRFAEQDLMVLLALILYNFKLECSLGHPLKQYYHTLLFPEEPLGILFKSHRNG